MELPFAGYPGQVWATCWQSLSWLSGVLSSSSSTSDLDDPVNGTFSTLTNGLSALSAWQIGSALTLESQNLAAVQALAITITSGTQTYFDNRIAAVTAAASGILSLVPVASPFNVGTTLAAGSPAIAYTNFIEWCMTTGLDVEAPPTGLTRNNTPSLALAEAQAWLDVANAVNVLQGDNLTAAYDTAARQYRCSAVVASGIPQLPSLPFGQRGASTLWNGAVALPTILLDATTLYSSPATIIAQQVGVIRYALLFQAQQLARLLLALRVHDVTRPVTATLRNTESLPDLASRATGNFEDWAAIARLNALQPPYPGPTNPAVAQSGRQLFLAGTGILPDPDAMPPTYAANVLGTDWNWGPINGAQPAWLGDISLITGYLNFARSIGRRIQTPLGSLVYHSSYGSRIPAEVGAVQSVDEAQRLVQYGKSAILSDPRTGSISIASGSVEPGFSAIFSALVNPIGPGATPVGVNETIGARP